MRGVVVHDHMNVQLHRYLGLDFAKEGQELLMSMLELVGGENLPGKHLECREAGCRSLSEVGPIYISSVENDARNSMIYGEGGHEPGLAEGDKLGS